ncbi:MAG: ABC-F family ATP-binding cassette domain-containing protein [Planctomycetes bacterium]|nr:ABC-F family ATP-binding cassette domain-containing protein [Planctomycetota bacterium]
MAILRLSDIGLNFGFQEIFAGLGFELNKGEKVGLIGVNGCGKTSLLKIIRGEITPDLGEIAIQANIKIGYLEQEPKFEGSEKVYQYLSKSRQDIVQLEGQLEKITAEIEKSHNDKVKVKRLLVKYENLSRIFELAGGYDFHIRVKEVAAGVGLSADELNLYMNHLSGGQRSRVGLAEILVSDADLILLDEPTNNLDWHGQLWLEMYLRKYKGAAVIVSHDRYLLDRVITRVVEVNGKRAFSFKGNYSVFLAQRQQMELESHRQQQKKSDFVAKTIDFIDRNRNQKGMQKVARGRAKHLEKMLNNSAGDNEYKSVKRDFNFAFAESGDKSKRPGTVLNCCELGMKFGETVLFENMNFELSAGQRLGITGPNGMGKTTLLKLALGNFEPTKGKISIKKSVSVGFLDQSAENFGDDNSVLEEMHLSAPHRSNQQLRGLLGAFLFSRDDVFKQVGDLSGGEKRRLGVCKMVAEAGQLLILDEPTNHLDTAGIEALENALEKHEGTVIVVSHDRYFLNRIAERLLVIGADKLGNKKVGCFEFIDGSFDT